VKDRSKKLRKIKSISPSRFDPSRTGGLRRALSQEINRRFAILKGRIVKLVVDEDSFGLAPSNHDPFALNCGGLGSGVPGPCPSGVETKYHESSIETPRLHIKVSISEDKTRAFFSARLKKEAMNWLDEAMWKDKEIGLLTLDIQHASKSVYMTRMDIEKKGAGIGPELLKAGLDHLKGLYGLTSATGYIEHSNLASQSMAKKLGAERSKLSKHGDYWTIPLNSTVVVNAFCPTGKGGGRDPSCGADVKKTVKTISKSLPSGFATAVKENLKKTLEHDSSDALTKRLRQQGHQIDDEKRLASYDRATGTLHVVKGASSSVIAHELGHVVDGPMEHLSRAHEFVAAWKKEASKLSAYATSHPAEALAEILRVGHEEGHAAVAAKVPKMLKALKSLGFKWHDIVTNAFCPTGHGGGVDPTCSPKHSAPIEVEISDGQKELVREKFSKLGLPGTPEETMPKLVAALPGSTVSITTDAGKLIVRVEHADYYCERHFIYDGDGQKHVYNSEFAVQDRDRRGLGTDIFSKQVAACSEAGFSHIETMAAGYNGGRLNGYYTWPRLGYDMSLDNFGYSKQSEALEAEARKKFPGAESILDIMKTPEGQQWWKKNGLTMTKAIFDLTPGSRSRQVLETYLEEREKRSSSQMTKNSLSTPLGRDLESDGTPAANAAWQFNPDNDKIRAFQQWMRQQLLQTLTGKTEEDLWRAYVEQGLKKGLGRAYDDVNRSRKDQAADQKQLDFYQGSAEDFVRSSFNRPVSVEKVQLLASRSFDEIQGMTSDMLTSLSRTLTDGLVQKKGPLEIARDLVKKLDISKQRAELIARTEIVRAHAEGQLIAFEAMGVQELGVAVEWSTSTDRDGNFDERVCSLCRPLEGAVFSIEESRGMIPRHPRCRCAWLPANVGEKTAGQMRTQAKIVKAVKASRRREGKKSTWKPSKPISKTRPQSQVRNAFCPTGKGGGVDPSCRPAVQHSLPFVDYKVSEKKIATDAGAREAFLKALQVQYPHGLHLYHEAPIEAEESIRKHGLLSQESAEDTNFATVGKSSEFISGGKVVVKVIIPKHLYKNVTPDMRYDPSNPAADLLREHSGVFGADVAYTGPIPKSWIALIKAVPVANRFCPTGPGGGVDPSCGLHPPVSTEVYRKLSPEDRSRITKVERERTALRKRIKEGGGTEEQIKKEAELSAEYKMLSDRARTGSASVQVKDSDTDAGPKLSHSSGITLADLKERVKGADLNIHKRGVVESAVKSAESSSAQEIRRHGMLVSETMVGFDLHIGDGKSVRVSYPPKLRQVVVDTMTALVYRDIHPTLLGATHTITFSSQKNQYDEYWAEQYGMKDLVSAATGGDGHMVVYNGGSVSAGTIAHESGHNLAHKLWGSTRPPEYSDYAKVQKQEPPVSEYGSKSPDEDFAEMAKMYTVDSLIKASRPKKYAAFEKILKAGAD